MVIQGVWEPGLEEQAGESHLSIGRQGGRGRTRQDVGCVDAQLRQGLQFDPAERASQGPSGLISLVRETLFRRGTAEPEAVSPDPACVPIGEQPWRAPGSTSESRPRVGRSAQWKRQTEANAVDWAMLRGCPGPAPGFGFAGAAPLTSGAVAAAAGAPVSDAPSR
ncbi:hypothetical protein NDU88_003712 [Pleurodeles waltl]|uniref:Uncharacterized protein n=1 Tax=Pleurodeles waltl TaxID=8319 RepID=A0AAV7VE60_PLEWA|nr:hypothetical protein NDU88_003712 [Pleurodeles waltl]